MAPVRDIFARTVRTKKQKHRTSASGARRFRTDSPRKEKQKHRKSAHPMHENPARTPAQAKNKDAENPHGSGVFSLIVTIFRRFLPGKRKNCRFPPARLFRTFLLLRKNAGNYLRKMSKTTGKSRKIRIFSLIVPYLKRFFAKNQTV